MKSIWTVISLLLLINVLLIGGGIGWLVKDGRLDRERFERVRDIFSITIQEEKDQALKAQELEEASRQKAMEIARLEAVSDGPVTLADRLRSEQLGDELAIQRIERLRRDISDMRRQLGLAQSMLAKKQQEIDDQRKAFTEAVERQAKLQEDADFQLTVSMLQQIKPKQGKQIFQELIKQGKRQQVVEYLAAMQLRKAAAVIKTFKSPQEIVQAADLLQTLRERGVDMAAFGSAGSPGPIQTPDPS